jgi:hypothetical protein
MDIAGAKALKERLGPNGNAEDPVPSADVSEDAPPVYHYLGVSDSAPEASPDEPSEAPADRGRSLLRRLRLISR